MRLLLAVYMAALCNIICTDSLTIVGGISYGIRFGFIEPDNVPVIFIYLFTSVVKLFTCPVNQLSTVRPPSYTRTQISYTKTNSHFTPQLSVCAPGDVTMSNLTHLAYLLERVQLPLASTKISFIRLLFILCWGFACVRLLSFALCYIMCTLCRPCFSEIR